MKIALIAPVEETIPPQKYGGTESIVYEIARGLGANGHQVDLYAAGNSKKDPFYNLIPVTPEALRLVPKYHDNLQLRESAKLLSIEKAVELINKADYDIIHNHARWRFLVYAHLLKIKSITTHHMPLDKPQHIEVYLQTKDHYHVSISNNQRGALPELPFIATVYNGVDTNTLVYNELDPVSKHDSMVYLARMSEDKGTIDAAKTAQRTQKKLFVDAKVDTVNEPYFQTFKPYIDNKYIFYRGETSGDEKVSMLQTARCLLVPVKWEEPFGLMFAEAMSCGTPVITYARGSAPEIVKDGVTGFLVNQSEDNIRGDWIVKKTGIDGLSEAVERLYSLPDDEYKKMRQASRKHVEDNFTIAKMIARYEEVYKTVMEKEGR